MAVSDASGDGVGTVEIAGLGLGLATKDRSTKIPHGAATGADNVSLYRGNLRDAPGYARVTNVLPRSPALLFDGTTHMLRSILGIGTTPFAIDEPAHTVEVLIDTSSIAGPQTVLYKGKGAAIGATPALANTDWMVTLEYDTSAGTDVLSVYLRISDTISFHVLKTAVTTSNGDPILPNTPLWIAFTYDENAGEAELFVYKPGEAPGTAVTGSPIAVQNSFGSFYVGGQPILDTAIVREDQVSQYHFQGVIQELRIWDDIRTATELEDNSESQIADTATVIGYFLTGGDGTQITDDTGNDVILSMEPTRATWEDQGLIASRDGKALAFDGKNDVLVVPNAYLYRSPNADEDGKLLAYESWWFAMQVRVDVLTDHSTILHYTHLSKSDYVDNVVSATVMSGAVTFTDERFGIILEVAEDATHAGEYEFRAIVMGHEAIDPTEIHAECVSTDLSTGAGGGIAVGTSYHVMVTYDATTTPGVLKIWLDGENSNASPDTQFFTSAGLLDYRLIPTDNDPIGSAQKYLMLIGGAAARSRKGESNQADPNDIDWQPDGTRYFAGALDQVVIGSGLPPATTTVNLRGKLLSSEYLTRAMIASLNTSVLSCWLLHEGAGDVLEDIGIQGNAFTFLESPQNLRANSRIDTIARGKVLGIVDQHYRTPTGAAKRLLAVHNGGIAEIDESTATLDHLFDGIRNNANNIIGLSRWRDTVILCTGEQPNMMIWRDELYPLSIEPPTGFIPWGVTDQLEGGNLKRGRRTIGFTYWSDFQGKRSPLGATISFELRHEANVVLGLDAEMMQTTARTIRSLKAPYDLTGNDTWLRIQAWLDGEEGGPGTGDPGNTHVKFTDNAGNKKPWISDKDSVTLEEMANAIELRAKRVFVKTFGDDTFEIHSRFLGSDARLKVQNAAGGADTIDVVFGSSTPMGFSSGPFSGTGLVFAATTITRAAGSWITDGWAIGKTPRISNAEDAANDGDWTITGISATVLTFAAASFTANLDDESAILTDTDIIDGTGVSGHSIPLPFPEDKQVTHLEIWMTLADGNANDMRLVARVPRGTESYKIQVSDELLTGEVLENDLGPVPKCRYVVPFGARRLYFGDPLEPQTLYISEPNRPWFVRDGAAVEFVDGRDLELTMAIGAEDNVILCKNTEVLVLTPTGNPNVPFQSATRFRNTGAVAAFGAVEVMGTAMWPDDEGIIAYDTSSVTDLTEVIEDTYEALDPSTRSNIAGALYERENVVGWASSTGETLVDGAKVNDQVLWYNYQVGRGPDGRIYGWTIQTAINATLWALVQSENRAERLFFADTFGYIYEYGVGKYAGNWDGSAILTTVSLVVSAGSSTTVTVPQATLSNLPDGHKGLWVTLNHVSGAMGGSARRGWWWRTRSPRRRS
ncbi:MAG: hypothetical protein IPK26_26310 [Planctomycetes bacterium]|nr:hypothetical protein [Planctomycetota bacterium]